MCLLAKHVFMHLSGFGKRFAFLVPASLTAEQWRAPHLPLTAADVDISRWPPFLWNDHIPFRMNWETEEENVLRTFTEPWIWLWPLDFFKDEGIISPFRSGILFQISVKESPNWSALPQKYRRWDCNGTAPSQSSLHKQKPNTHVNSIEFIPLYLGMDTRDHNSQTYQWTLKTKAILWVIFKT